MEKKEDEKVKKVRGREREDYILYQLLFVEGILDKTRMYSFIRHSPFVVRHSLGQVHDNRLGKNGHPDFKNLFIDIEIR